MDKALLKVSHKNKDVLIRPTTTNAAIEALLVPHPNLKDQRQKLIE